jgi:hypothetical protein
MTGNMGPKLAKALVAFQGEAANVASNKVGKIRTRDGGGYEYRYADLAAVLAELKPKLAKHGLAIVQQTTNDPDQGFGVETWIIHESGETWDAGRLILPPQSNTSQAAGAAISYARRYGLSGLGLIAVEDDPDGREHGDEPPPSTKSSSGKGYGEHFDDDVGFGKFKGTYSWRQLTEGSIGGERHKWLNWQKRNLNPNESATQVEKLKRVNHCLSAISKRADQDAAKQDGQAPEDSPQGEPKSEPDPSPPPRGDEPLGFDEDGKPIWGDDDGGF